MHTWLQAVGVGCRQVVLYRAISPITSPEIGLHTTTETQMETMMTDTLQCACDHLHEKLSTLDVLWTTVAAIWAPCWAILVLLPIPLPVAVIGVETPSTCPYSMEVSVSVQMPMGPLHSMYGR